MGLISDDVTKGKTMTNKATGGKLFDPYAKVEVSQQNTTVYSTSSTGSIYQTVSVATSGILIIMVGAFYAYPFLSSGQAATAINNVINVIFGI